MPLILEPETHTAVEADGLPRVADYDDGSRHVLYLDSEIVRSLAEAEWVAQHGALPTMPTFEKVQAALDARAAERAARSNEAVALRQAVIARGQALVGARADQLTGAELRDLFLVVLWDMGALNSDLTVRPLREWVDR